MKRFYVEFFFAVPKNFAGELSVLCFREIPVANKCLDKKGWGSIKIFRRKYLCHSAKKFRRGTL